MLVYRFDEILAKTDPFDLAQALDRSVRSMPAQRVRELILDAHERMGAYYRNELLRLLDEQHAIPVHPPADPPREEFVHLVQDARDDAAVARAFSRLLKSNLRAIPIFGPAFAQAIMRHLPADRTVAIGEERSADPMRVATIAGLALALVLAGAFGEHMVSTVRARAAATPLPDVTAPLAVLPVRHLVQRTAASRPAPTTLAPAAAAPTAPAAERTVAPPPAPQPQPLAITVVARPTLTPGSRTPARVPRVAATLPPAQGVATVNVPEPTPTVEPSPIDVSDMPEAYTDATPLPKETPGPAVVPHRVALKTPPPKPKHKGWLQRTILHLDPFKPSH